MLSDTESGNSEPEATFKTNNYEFTEAVDNAVRFARNGDFSYSIETILALAHCLKNRWPVPDSLADHMSESLLNAAIMFGHTEGKADKKYRAVAKAMGLSKLKGKPRDSFRDSYVYHYMKIRIDDFGESKYTAAQYAQKAFRNSEFSTEHDNLEATFDRYEKEVGGSAEDATLFLMMTKDHSYCPNGMVFNDNDFLKATLPFLKEDPSKFLEDYNEYLIKLFTQGDD